MTQTIKLLLLTLGLQCCWAVLLQWQVLRLAKLLLLHLQLLGRLCSCECTIWRHGALLLHKLLQLLLHVWRQLLLLYKLLQLLLHAGHQLLLLLLLLAMLVCSDQLHDSCSLMGRRQPCIDPALPAKVCLLQQAPDTLRRQPAR